jgi:hypothetical protein
MANAVDRVWAALQISEGRMLSSTDVLEGYLEYEKFKGI